MFKNSVRFYSYKTALITGGSQGVGWEIAKNLTRVGYNCILLARDEHKLKSNVNELSKINGLKHEYIKFDLSKDLDQLNDIVGKYYDKRQGKSIDVLVNCAGASQSSILPMTSVPSIQDIISVNLTSSIVLSKIVSRNLLNIKRPGQIINISSVLALDQYSAVKGTSVYSLTKMALITFTKKLSEELKERHIYSNVILPSLIQDTGIGQSANTEILKEFGVSYISKESVAHSVLRILEHDSNGSIIIL